MAPIRRYLRITKHSVLEVRIYLDRPADADAWLLKRDEPALPRVIQAIRPLVLPKLREENERAKGKGSGKAKKKGVKDVVVEDDFEVAIFLTDVSSRHSVMTKQKVFRDKARIQSNSGKLTNWLTSGTVDQPIVVNEETIGPIVIREEDDEDLIKLVDIPQADSLHDHPSHPIQNDWTRKDADQEPMSNASDNGDPALFVSQSNNQPTGIRGRRSHADQDEDITERPEDDKKKLGLKTCYDGFSIYGRILCLIVKRRGTRSQARGGSASPSHTMLENWVSTQAAGDGEVAG